MAEVPLAQVGEAHAALESGRTVGKLVLVSRP
ncbi:MAG: zinc-binding dehydrogenase [bacterium]